MSINFASPTMLQSVTCLSFSVFGGSLKIEFGKLQSMFNLCFSAKTLQSSTEQPKREGEVSILTVIFLSLAPSPQIHFPQCAERFFLATIFFFFLPSFACLYSRLYERPSGFKIIFSFQREFGGVCQGSFFPGCQ